MKKYELTEELIEVEGKKLYRIKALVDIPKHDVKIGDFGGFVENEKNLSNESDAWITVNAVVTGDAVVTVNAVVTGNAWVTGNAVVTGNTDYIVIYPIGSECSVFTAYKAKSGIECNRGCFSGNIEEFEKAVKKTHGENKYAKEYKKVIELVKIRLGEYNI